MKAIVLQPGTTNLHLKDLEEPQIKKPNEFKVKVLRVGICGTDREEASGGRASPPIGETELIIGHEMLSQVIEVGSDVKSIQPGDHVVITVRRGCNQCEACKAFRSDMCTTGNYTERGIKGRNGFQSEFVVDEEQYAVKVPPTILDIAVLTEPMSVVEKAIEQANTIQSNRLPFLKTKESWLNGKTVIVAGLGPIGLLGSMILSLRGATVLGLDIVQADHPQALLLQAMGGTYVNSKELDVVKFQKKYPQIDLILDAAGIAKLDFDLLSLLGINGIFVLTGVPGKQKSINIDGSTLMRKLVLKNQVMLGSVNESIDHFKKGITDLEAARKKWPGTIQKFITKKFSIHDYEKALLQHTQDEIKVIIEWSSI